MRPLKEYISQGKKHAISGLRWVKANKLKFAISATLASIGFILIFFLMIYFGAFGKIPSGAELKEIKNPLTTTIYSGNNDIIGNYYVENRSNMDSIDINEAVRNALIATEDIRFYDHDGIDYKSLGRVLVKSLLLQKKSSGGGSTITQQLAKNVFGRKKQYLFSTVINKVREMIIAKRLESVYDKHAILLLYLNTVPFGDRIYGLEKAAERYFDKKPSKLTITEAATLIGTLKATSYYNPKRNPDNALRRRNVVLNQMSKYGYLEKEEYDKLSAKPLGLKYTLPKLSSSFASFYKEYLRKEFDEWAVENPKPDGSLYNVDEDGLSIYTTIHTSIQKSMEKAVSAQMERLQEVFVQAWSSPMGKDSLISSIVFSNSVAKRMLEQGTSRKDVLDYFKIVRERQFWNGSKYVTAEASMIDSIVYDITTLQASSVAMHNQSGKIMAYVGGKDFGRSQYDNVQIPRQVGSTFKPIVYLAALQKGVEPCDFYDNELRTYSDYKDWSPRNADAIYGGAYSLKGALAKSINTVSVQVIFEAGIENVIELAKRLGITAKLPKVPSLVLGTAEISLMEMVRAYGAIANDGAVVEPYSMVKIVDESGKVLYQRKYSTEGIQVVDKEAVENLQKMMTLVNTEGTGARIQSYNIPYKLIGKTGTTQNNADGWYIGASPEITCGAWVGTRDPRVTFKSTSLGSGANTALPIVAGVYRDLSMWKTQIVNDFVFEEANFPCASYSELKAEEAELVTYIDSTELVNRISDIFKRIFQKKVE